MSEPSGQGLYPAEHRALRELYAMASQLASHWTRLAGRLGGAPGDALAAAIVAGAGVLVVLSRPGEAFAYAAANTTFVLGALMLFSAALVLSGSVPAPTAVRRHRRPDSPRARG